MTGMGTESILPAWVVNVLDIPLSCIIQCLGVLTLQGWVFLFAFSVSILWKDQKGCCTGVGEINFSQFLSSHRKSLKPFFSEQYSFWCLHLCS